MAPQTNPDINFLEIQREQARDEPRQLREAANVLSSYSHALDFLGEALQNATDAIDERRATEPKAPGKIVITFDVVRREFSVADTGIGMRKQDVRVVLTPNVTTKSGPYGRRRSRGEKGVGLSFLTLGSNLLRIRTSDGLERQEVTVTGARDWVYSEGVTPRPVGKHTTDYADSYVGSRRYTVVTVGGIHPSDFDRDLFGYGLDELVWELRTRTAIGNTRYLFEKPFSPTSHADEIEVTLHFVGADGTDEERRVPYAYATPEELAPERPVVNFSDVSELPAEEMVQSLRGAGVRFVNTLPTRSGRLVSIYAYITNGDEMRTILEQRRASGRWAPEDWQGFYIGTREMPTGVPLGVSVVPTRAYERRMFALLVEDELVLDMGRKTLHGQTRNMLVDVGRAAWKQLVKVVPRVAPEVTISEVDRAALDLLIERSRRHPDLNAPIPYLKAPTTRPGVIAVFHEVLATSVLALPRLRTLRTGTLLKDDELVYHGEPNGVRPLHVLFGLTAADVLKEIEDSGSLGRTADLAVVWDLGRTSLGEMGVQVTEADRTDEVATHRLLLAGVGGLDELRVLALRTLLTAD